MTADPDPDLFGDRASAADPAGADMVEAVDTLADSSDDIAYEADDIVNGGWADALLIVDQAQRIAETTGAGGIVAAAADSIYLAAEWRCYDVNLPSAADPWPS